MRTNVCRHCGEPTGDRDSRITTCGRCAMLLQGIDTPDPAPSPTPTPACRPTCRETEEARRQRFHDARVAHVRESFERGRRCLLARALDPQRTEWATICH